MPPKFKYTKEQIIDKAIELVRIGGIETLTARQLALTLGTSVKPIFTAFQNMDILKNNVIKRALEIYHKHLSDYADYTPAFKRHGMQFIRFAEIEPELFKLLFMQKAPPDYDFESSIDTLIGGGLGVLDIVMEKYGLERDDAKKLFKIMWLEGYGIASQIALGVCSFSEEQISEMLSITFIGALNTIKSGRAEEYIKISEVKHI